MWPAWQGPLVGRADIDQSGLGTGRQAADSADHPEAPARRTSAGNAAVAGKRPRPDVQCPRLGRVICKVNPHVDFKKCSRACRDCEACHTAATNANKTPDPDLSPAAAAAAALHWRCCGAGQQRERGCCGGEGTALPVRGPQTDSPRRPTPRRPVVVRGGGSLLAPYRAAAFGP